MREALRRLRSRRSSPTAANRVNPPQQCPPAKEVAGAELWMEAGPFRAAGRRVVEQAVRHCMDVATGSRPVNAVVPAAVKQGILCRRMPEAPQSPHGVLADVWALLEKFPLGNGHPRCFAWIVGGMPPVAELMETAVNTYGAWSAATSLCG